MKRSRGFRLHGWSPMLTWLCVIGLPLVVSLPQSTAAAVDWPHIVFGKAITNLPNPVFITNARDGSNRLFVVDQSGYIRIVKGAAPQATPFLDIHDRVQFNGERGLLSVAFPPGYGQTAAKRHFYVYYVNKDGNLVIARYSLTSTDDDVANASSEEILLTIQHPGQSNHNGGQLQFSPRDGYLYIGTGDGGGGGDPNRNGQNLNALLGKILRIDVESGVSPYRIPPDNPFVSRKDARHEIWAYGVRNPWRFSFDRSTHDLYIGDVGQGEWEEVDVQAAASTGGQDYGWNIMEGRHCYNASTCDQTGLVLPVTEYSHQAGDCSITGGYVYRGTKYPRLLGVYVYGDYCTGQIRGLQRDGSDWATTNLLDTPYSITSFGEDEAGTIYLANYAAGEIYPIGDTIEVQPRVWLPLILNQGRK